VNTILAQRAADARRWDLALQAMVRLEDLVPGVMEVVELRRHLAESCGDGEVLRELFTDLLDRDPNQPEIRVRLARLLGADGDAVAARAVLEEGLERSPGNAVLLMELAGIERLAGNQDRAIELAHQVLAVRPQDRQAQRLLELLGEEGEDFSWMRSPEELWKMADAATPASPAVVLLDHRELHFLPSNLSEERVQTAFLITEAVRADDLLTRSLPYVAEKEQLRVLRARVLRRDGGEVSASQSNTPRLAEPEFNLYYDTRLRILRFPEVSDGDVLEIAYILTETEEANETGPYNGGLMMLGQRLPAELVEVEMSGPADRMPEWELAGLEGEPESQMVEGGEIRLRWTWRNLAAIPADVPPAPALLVVPYLVYSNHPNWGDLADWYQRHVAPRIRASAQVEEVARRLVDGVEDRRDRIDRIYRFVTNDVRYVGLEFGEHRFRPFSADWVLHHEIGDCKDKAALLVALYGAIGVPARMVMVRTADLGPMRTKIAALEFFNHAIAYLPEDDLWLDGTASGHAPYPPPGPDQGAVVLVVDGPTSELETSPAVGGGLSRESYVLRAGEGGFVQLEMRSEDTGGAADRRRALFAGSKETVRVARWLQSVFPGAELTGEPKLHLPPGRDPTTIEVRGSVPRAALASAGGVRAFPGDLGWKASSFPGGSRHGPLEMEVRPDLQWTLEVELGRAPSVLAPPVDLETPYGTLRLDLRPQPLGYRVEGFLHLEPGLVEAAEYRELRDFLVAVERHLQRRLEAP
jgi:tetratricopeptide (TPR) repeat protein